MSKADRFRKLADNREPEDISSNKPEVINKIVGAESTQVNSNSVAEQTDATVIMNTAHEQTSATVTSNTNVEHSDVTLIRNSDTEQSDVTVHPKTSVRARIPKPIEEFEKKLKKPTVEETHTRGTWLIRNDLLKRLEKLSKNQQRGFKTYVVNYALERILDELEGK